MALESTVTTQTILSDGVSREFEFTFRVWPVQIAVYLVDPSGLLTTITNDCNIFLNDTGTPDEGYTGGRVEYPRETSGDPVLPAGYKIIVSRDMNFLQETVIKNNDPFDGRVLDARIDLVFAHLQQLREEVDRKVGTLPGSVSLDELISQMQALLVLTEQYRNEAEIFAERAEAAQIQVVTPDENGLMIAYGDEEFSVPTVHDGVLEMFNRITVSDTAPSSSDGVVGSIWLQRES